MRLLVLSLVALLAGAGTGFAQTNAGSSITPEVLRGTSADPAAKKKTTAAPPKAVNVQRAAAQKNAVSQTNQKKTSPEQLRAARYGGFAPSAPLPTPELDTTSPRSLTLINFNTKEEITVTYWSNGAYYRAALDKLNFFLRDSRDNTQTEMDPLLFDVLWHTARISGYAGPIEVLSSFRSASTNAWLPASAAALRATAST